MKKFENKITVTQPSLPDISDFTKLLEKIWENKWLTNNGEYHVKFENSLAEFLKVENASLFSNGTLALIIGLQALRITGEVITTPYSFVATSHALNWNGIEPVFCDIDKKTGNLDPSKIVSLITPKTSAILPVHVYGNPCNTKEIQEIADIYGLKVIYDAAHAFGVEVDGQSILNEGDMSILSFHATKTFNTAEGGAIITKDEKLKNRIDFLKNFGFADETVVIGPGINAKMNELQAAMGFLQLKSFNDQVIKRKEITQCYRNGLKDINGLTFFYDFKNVKHNYGYFPIFIDEEKLGLSRDDIYFEMRAYNVFCRRYFYPLISDFPTYKHLESSKYINLKNAKTVANQVICLPIYADLKINEVENIISIIRHIVKA